MPCSDARSNLACAFPETAVVALLILRRVTWTRLGHSLSLAARGALALHRREAPFAPWGYLPAAQLPTQGTTEMRENSWLSKARSQLPKIGARAPRGPVTLRYSGH